MLSTMSWFAGFVLIVPIASLGDGAYVSGTALEINGTGEVCAEGENDEMASSSCDPEAKEDATCLSLTETFTTLIGKQWEYKITAEVKTETLDNIKTVTGMVYAYDRKTGSASKGPFSFSCLSKSKQWRWKPTGGLSILFSKSKPKSSYEAPDVIDKEEFLELEQYCEMASIPCVVDEIEVNDKTCQEVNKLLDDLLSSKSMTIQAMAKLNVEKDTTMKTSTVSGTVYYDNPNDNFEGIEKSQFSMTCGEYKSKAKIAKMIGTPETKIAKMIAKNAPESNWLEVGAFEEGWKPNRDRLSASEWIDLKAQCDYKRAK